MRTEMEIEELFRQAEALKDRKLGEEEFEEAADIRDLILTIKRAPAAIKKLTKIVQEAALTK